MLNSIVPPIKEEDADTDGIVQEVGAMKKKDLGDGVVVKKVAVVVCGVPHQHHTKEKVSLV
jgi:hypothetical protein